MMDYLSDIISVEPTVEPVTVDDLAKHLRLDDYDGETAPDKCTVALAGVAGNLDNADYRYRVTFTTAEGETEGGIASSVVTVADNSINGQVTVSNIPTGAGIGNITGRKLYRTEGDGNEYKLLITLSDVTTTTYTDNIADGSLTTTAPIVNTTENCELNHLIKAGRLYVEKYLRRALITQTRVFTINAFPGNGQRLYIPKGKLQSISSIKYIDTDGTQQTWSSAEYDVFTSSDPAYVINDYDYDYPSIRNHDRAVEITYICGYGDTRFTIPYEIKQSILLLCAEMYENREITTFKQKYEIPLGIKNLLAPSRLVIY